MIHIKRDWGEGRSTWCNIPATEMGYVFDNKNTRAWMHSYQDGSQYFGHPDRCPQCEAEVVHQLTIYALANEDQ